MGTQFEFLALLTFLAVMVMFVGVLLPRNPATPPASAPAASGETAALGWVRGALLMTLLLTVGVVIFMG